MQSFCSGDKVRFVKALNLDGMTGEVIGFWGNEPYADHCIVLLDAPIDSPQGKVRGINITKYCLERIA